MALNLDDSTQLNYLPQPALDRIAKMKLFDTNCAGHQMLEHIANKWTVLIVYALTQGKKRKERTQTADCRSIAQDADPKST